jgi:hypothetical protein
MALYVFLGAIDGGEFEELISQRGKQAEGQTTEQAACASPIALVQVRLTRRAFNCKGR